MILGGRISSVRAVLSSDLSPAIAGGVAYALVWYVLSGGQNLVVPVFGGAVFALAWYGVSRLLRLRKR